jgi:hypothetical protein
MTAPGIAARLLIGLALMGGAWWGAPEPQFDHEKHARVFPDCVGCHAGILDPGKSIYPAAQVCESCHDGEVKKQVDYQQPTSPPSNFRFTHTDHFQKSAHRFPGDSAVRCQDCHIPTGAAWLTVRRTIQPQCFGCHGIRTAHFAAPDTACGVCHLALAEARGLPETRIAKFDKPDTHRDPEFPAASGHGKLAKGGDQSCAICHARDFCAQCHVNAPEVNSIQALAPDPRSLALHVDLKAPASHQKGSWGSRHASAAQAASANCVFCHTQESCATCHRTLPAVALALPVAGPGRAPGAHIDLKRTGYHPARWADQHGPTASAKPGSCSACHQRAECLECHRPNLASGGTYHPAGFLVRHPAAAFNRQADCATCHNTTQFCATCHQKAGLVANGQLAGGYHDASGAFLLNHGTAARQNIENCIACHAERDCLACHSAQGGRHFNPHGPGFDPDRLRSKNPQTCAACHGRNIPPG